MRSAEIEAWVFRVVDAARRHHTVEDSRVEAKAIWPKEIDRTARQLAAHANAAQGELILWVVGLDEKTGTISPALFTELADWYPQISNRFDGVAPALDANLVVDVDGIPLLALVFATDRVPYVVKIRDGNNGVQREVPRRVGNGAQSATHEQLIRMLQPVSMLPLVEVLEARTSLRWWGSDAMKWALWLDLYVAPTTPDVVVLPFHSLWAMISDEDGNEICRMPATFQVRSSSATIERSSTETVVHGPGSAVLTGETEALLDVTAEQLIVTAHLRPAGSERSVVVSTTVEKAPLEGDREIARWRNSKAPAWER